MLTEQEYNELFGQGDSQPAQKPKAAPAEPKESKGFLGTVLDTAKGAVSGVFKEAENVVQTGHDVANFVDDKFLGDKYVDNDKDYDFVPDAIKPETSAGKTAQALSAFATGWVAGGKAINLGAKALVKGPAMLKLAAATPKPAKYVKTALKGGVVDFITGDASDERLADVIVDNDVLGSSVAQFLASDDDDSAAEARLKNVIEGFVVGGAVDAIVPVLKFAKKGFKSSAKNTVEATLANRKIGAEAVANGTADAVLKTSATEQTVKDAVQQRLSKVKLTPQAAKQRSLTLLRTDPVRKLAEDKAALEEIKKYPAKVSGDDIFNTRHYVKDAQDLIEPLKEDIGEEFTKDTPFMMETSIKAQEFNLANHADKVFDVEPLIKGVNDYRIDTMARVQWLNSYALDHMKMTAQKVHEGVDGALTEARTRLEGILDVLLTQKQVNTFVGQTGKANDAIRNAGADGIIKTKHASGIRVDVPDGMTKVAMAKDILAEKTDEELTELMTSYIRVAETGDTDTLLKVIASSTPKGHPLRTKIAGMDNPIWDSVVKFRYAAMLSSMKTHARNFIGNTSKIPLTAFEQIVKGAAAGYQNGGFVGALHGAREGVYFTQGLYYAQRQAATTFMDALRYGEAITRPSEYNQIAGGMTKGAVFSGVDKVSSYPLRLLAASDEYFASLGGTAAAYQQAMTDLRASGILQKTAPELRGEITSKWLAEYMPNAFIDTVTKDGQTLIKGKTLAFETSREIADEVTFQQKLDGIGKIFADAVNKYKPLKVLFPFVKTPMNIFKDAFWTRGVGVPVEVWQAMKSGDPAKQAEAVAHMTSAVILWCGVYALVENGVITGRGSDKKFQREMQMNTGWRPNSFKAGDTYYDLNMLEPYGSMLGFGATAVELNARGADLGDALFEAFWRTAKDKTFMKGFCDLINTLDRGQALDERGFPSQVALSFIPGLLRDLGQSMDPVKRATPDFYDKAYAKLPILSEELAPKVNWLTGREIDYDHGGGIGALIDFTGSSEERYSAVFNELSRVSGVAAPSDKIGSMKLSPNDYAEYCRTIGTVLIDGKTLYQTLDEFVNSDEYQNDVMNNPDPTPYELEGNRNKMLTAIIKQFKDTAKAQFLQEHEYLADNSAFTNEASEGANSYDAITNF